MDVIVYNIHLTFTNSLILIQLYNSLKTLRDYNKDIPVIVVIEQDTNIIPLYNEGFSYIINGKFNLIKDFDDVEFVFMKNNYKYSSLFKWCAIREVFNTTNHNKILYLNNNTFFTTDPLPFFEEFDKKYLWGITDTTITGNDCFHTFGFRGMNSGQFLISRRVFNKLYKDFIRVIEKRMTSYPTVTPGWEKVSAEYCTHKVFEKYKVEFSEFPKGLISLGNESVIIDHTQNPCKILNPIVHYPSDSSYLWLSKEYEVFGFWKGVKNKENNKLPHNLNCKKCYTRIFGEYNERSDNKDLKRIYQNYRQRNSN